MAPDADAELSLSGSTNARPLNEKAENFTPGETLGVGKSAACLGRAACGSWAAGPQKLEASCIVYIRE
jgi:hypothetical protein